MLALLHTCNASDIIYLEVTAMPPRDRQLGDYVKRQREAAERSMAQLAGDAGIPRSQVMRIERGDIRPGPETLGKLARALKVDVEDLYALAGYAAPEQLPGFEPYLRARHGWSDEAIAEALAVFERIERDQGDNS